MKGVTLPTETVFVMEASPIKFGLGAMDEIAYDARRLGLKRVLIVTDRHIGELGLPDRVRALLEEEGIKADVYDGVEIEPTDRSMEEAAEGCDILTHAIESYTTRPYNARAKHHPPDRPAYIGANPASDIWCEKAIEYVGRYLRRAVLSPLDLDARVNLALAANYAGVGFGNAGVHIPHALAYPIAGLVRDYA